MVNLSKRNILIFLTVFAVVAVAAGAFYALRGAKRQEEGSFIQYKERNLNVEQRQIYQERLNRAESALKALNPMEPNYKVASKDLHIAIAQQYYGLGELGKARVNYEAAAALVDSDLNIYTGLSLVQDEQGDFTSASISLEKALSLYNISPDLWIRFINYKKDRMGEGREGLEKYYKEALEKTGRHPDVLANYAALLVSFGEKGSAIQLYEEAAERAQNKTQYEAVLKQLKS